MSEVRLELPAQSIRRLRLLAARRGVTVEKLIQELAAKLADTAFTRSV